jgi:predicted transcriptional regulator
LCHRIPDDFFAELERDYKNLYQDVKILEESGMIEWDSKKHIIAPRKKPTLELPLAV